MPGFYSPSAMIDVWLFGVGGGGHVWMYLLGGSCLFPLLLNLLRAMGSKVLANSSDGGGMAKEDESSTCFKASVVA